MKLSGKDYTEKELIRRSNNLSSLYTARRLVLADGKAAGLRAVEVRTAGGLRMLLNQDRCLDIMELSFKGVNIGFLTANGLNSNAMINLEANQDYLSLWIGGMLTTCGLRSAGNMCSCNGEIFPKHGSIGITAAENVNISADGENITITGIMREASMGRCNLELFRQIKVPVDGARVVITDKIRNLSSAPEITFYMYHTNFGFPFLDEGLEVVIPPGEVVARDTHSRTDDCRKIIAPQDGLPGDLFFHTLARQNNRVDLKNKQLGLQASVLFDSAKLPVLLEWRSMCAGNYALSIEPGTSKARGRKTELDEGYNLKIAPWGEMTYGMELAFADF